MPCVSVVIPAYNAEKYISAALDSVFRQSFDDFEVLVIDDGSSDRTGQIVTGSYPRVRYLAKRNGGASSARNHGVENAVGEFIAFLDADDAWHPEKLEAQVALMRAYPQANLCRTAISERSFQSNHSLYVHPDDELPRHSLVPDFSVSFLDPYFATSTVMVRREVFTAIGGFDTRLKIAEDVDFYLRLLVKSPVVPFVEGVSIHKRTVVGSLGDNSEAGYVQLFSVYRDFLKNHPGPINGLGPIIIRKSSSLLWARYAGSMLRNGKRAPAIWAAMKSLFIFPSTFAIKVIARAIFPRDFA